MAVPLVPEIVDWVALEYDSHKEAEDKEDVEKAGEYHQPIDFDVERRREDSDVENDDGCPYKASRDDIENHAGVV